MEFADNFDDKLIEADKVEEYDPNDIENSRYLRDLVPCYSDNTLETCIGSAWLYFIRKLDDGFSYWVVPQGDWAVRDRSFQ